MESMMLWAQERSFDLHRERGSDLKYYININQCYRIGRQKMRFHMKPILFVKCCWLEISGTVVSGKHLEEGVGFGQFWYHHPLVLNIIITRINPNKNWILMSKHKEESLKYMHMHIWLLVSNLKDAIYNNHY